MNKYTWIVRWRDGTATTLKAAHGYHDALRRAYRLTGKADAVQVLRHLTAGSPFVLFGRRIL